MFVRHDIGCYRIGRDFNRKDHTDRAKSILETNGIPSKRLIITPSDNIHNTKRASRLVPISGREPGIMIDAIWLQIPVYFASIVIHEMVHMDQYVRGDLKWVNDDLVYKGRVYGPHEYTGRNAHLLPFEKDAYAAQIAFLDEEGYIYSNFN